MGAQIFSRITPGTYAVIADSGVIRDQDLFSTQRKTVLFRGTQDQIHQTFSLGNADSDETNMLCAGPTSISLCEGTARNPHWEVEVQWVGIHGATSAGIAQGIKPGNWSKNFNYKLLYNWSRTETRFPIVNRTSGEDDYTTYISTPYVSNELNALGTPQRARLIHFVPMIQIVGVMISEGPPNPFSGSLSSLITSLNPTAAVSTAAAWQQDWSSLKDTMKTWAKGFLESSKQTGVQGAFVPVSMQTMRHLCVGKAWAFTCDLTWEQGITPG